MGKTTEVLDIFGEFTIISEGEVLSNHNFKSPKIFKWINLATYIANNCMGKIQQAKWKHEKLEEKYNHVIKVYLSFNIESFHKSASKV